MRALQYPGIRIQQVKDEKTRTALSDLSGHLKALYGAFNSAVNTEYGPGSLRLVQPIVIPEVGSDPMSRSTRGRPGQLARVQDSVFMKTGREGEDTEWTPLPTGAIGFAAPTATIGLFVVPGTATSFMRSDAAPPLSQNIQPIWTAVHRFSNYVEYDEVVAPGTPSPDRVRLYAKDKAGVSNLYFKKDDGTEVDLSAGGTITGSGTDGRIPRFSGSGTNLGNSLLSDDGTNVGLIDSGSGFKTTFDTTNVTADQTLYWSQANPSAPVIITGSDPTYVTDTNIFSLACFSQQFPYTLTAHFEAWISGTQHGLNLGGPYASFEGSLTWNNRNGGSASATIDGTTDRLDFFNSSGYTFTGNVDCGTVTADSFNSLIIPDNGAGGTLLDISNAKVVTIHNTVTVDATDGANLGFWHGRLTAKTSAQTVFNQSIGSADCTVQVMANVLVTTSTSHNFIVTVDYTDEGNTARTVTLTFSQLIGTFITNITNLTGAGPYEGVPLTLRCKASTNVVFKTANGGGTNFTTVTYNVDAAIMRVA